MLEKYYKILELSSNASQDDIKKAYKKLAFKYHPDRNKEKDAETKFKEISNAYQILTNKDSKLDSTQINPNDLFAHIFSSGGIGIFQQMHPMAHVIRGGIGQGIQINIQNFNSNPKMSKRTVNTQIVNGNKIETIIEEVNGVQSVKRVITKL